MLQGPAAATRGRRLKCAASISRNQRSVIMAEGPGRQANSSGDATGKIPKRHGRTVPRGLRGGMAPAVSAISAASGPHGFESPVAPAPAGKLTWRTRKMACSSCPEQAIIANPMSPGIYLSNQMSSCLNTVWFDCGTRKPLMSSWTIQKNLPQYTVLVWLST